MNSGDKKISEKDFDLLLKSKMEQGSLGETPKGWDKLLSELSEHKKAVPFTPPVTAGRTATIWGAKQWLAAACGMALVVGAAIWSWNSPSLVDEVPDQKVTHSQQPQPPTTPKTQQETPIDNNSTLNKRSPQSSATPHYVAYPKSGSPMNHNSKKPMSNALGVVVEDTTLYVVTPKEVQRRIEDPTVLNRNSQPQEELHKETGNNSVNANANLFAYQAPVSDHSFQVGLNGGFNFGSLNTGYAVAIKGRVHLTSDLFLDGTVGVNRNTMPHEAVSVASGNIKARPAFENQSALNMPAVKKMNQQQLLYVQFNPSIGYKVTKNLNVSIGGDLQRIVKDRKNDNDVNVLYNSASNSVAIIPETDLGLTAKTEMKLSKKISAGILYREGINNLISNKQEQLTNYMNRRYIQVQLTYNFL